MARVLRTAAVVLIASLASLACARHDVRRGQGPGVAPSACPDDDVLETLHDAVFFLEHRRDIPRAVRDLERIQRRVGSGNPGSEMLLSLAERIAKLAARDGVLEPDSEVIRAELHAWPCVTTEAHERFHRALPPLP